MVASRLTKQEEGEEQNRKSHMTSSLHRTMHMTLQHPARWYRHTLQVMQLTFRCTHTHRCTRALRKTNYKL